MKSLFTYYTQVIPLLMHATAATALPFFSKPWLAYTALRVHQQAERAASEPPPPTAFGSTPPAR